MKFIKLLPFNCVYNDDLLECAIWKAKENKCEFQREGHRCDTSGVYYGTSSEHEPKFCARHFYMEAVNGDGKTNYKLTNEK